MSDDPRFFDSLKTEHLDCQWHRVLNRFRYKSEITGSILTVPEGFVTDFASVPRLPLTYTLFGNKTCEAALIHDYLYRFTKIIRKAADRIYLEAMRVRGYGYSTRYSMYWGVRSFGWYIYGKHEGKLDPRGG